MNLTNFQCLLLMKHDGDGNRLVVQSFDNRSPLSAHPPVEVGEVVSDSEIVTRVGLSVSRMNDVIQFLKGRQLPPRFPGEPPYCAIVGCVEFERCTLAISIPLFGVQRLNLWRRVS